MLKRSAFLPFALPTIDDEEIEEVVSTLKSGWLSTGPKVREFEAALANYVGASHAVAVSSCTAGLHLSLRALGVGPDDEVIVPTMTFCSTANVVEHLGARVVLADCGPDGNIDAAAVASLITPRTKAIVPVHFGGQAVDLDAIYRVAAQHGLAVVEDAAHAIGASYRGAMIGADVNGSEFGLLRRTVVYSFYATKNLATGEGGMVVTNDEELADAIRISSLHGMSRDAWKRYTSAGSWYYEVVEPGFKANMTDLQAAIGLHQLKKLDSFNATRRHQAELYDTLLQDQTSLAVPQRHDDRSHVFHLYVIQVDGDRLSIDRSQFIDALRDYNIGTSVHFIPVHAHPYYRDNYNYKNDQFPAASSRFEQSISLPIYPRLEDSDIEYVAQTVRFIADKYLTA